MKSKEQFIQSGYDTQKITELNKDFVRYKSARDKWARRALEYEMVVNNDVDGTGTQFTDKELQSMKERYGIPLSVNISVAFIEQLQAFLTSPKLSVTCIPIGNSSKPYAYVHREYINSLLYFNDFPIKQEKTIFDMAVVGHGILYVTLSDFFISNMFNVNIKNLDWRSVYFDPFSKEQDYQDSERIFVVVPMMASKAKKIYNLTDDELEFACSTLEDYEGLYTNNNNLDITWVTPEMNNNVWIHEIYEKVFATMYMLENGKKVFDSPNATVVDENGQLVKLVNGVKVVDELNATFVKRYLKVGNLIKDERILPIRLYPFAIYNHTHVRSPFPYGIVHHFIDIQHTLNKCLALTIENAQVSANGGWTAPEGSIQDKNKFQKEMSTPGGVGEYAPDQNLPNGGQPQQKLPQPLNTAWYTLFQQLIKLVEYITGIYELNLGNSENAPNTVGATQSIQSFGTQRPKMYARRIDIANQRLGEILIQMYQAFAPQGNLMTLINETEAYGEIETNVSAIVDKQTGQVSIDDRGQDKATIIRNLVTQQVAVITGDIRAGQYKVRFASSTDLPTTRQAAMNVLTSLMSRMSNDATAVAIAQATLKLMDYPEIDKVLRDTDMIQQLQNTITQQQEQLKQVIDSNKKLESENESLEKKAILADMDAENSKRMARLDMIMGKMEEMKNKAEKKDASKSETIS